MSKPLKIAPGIGERLVKVRGTKKREEFCQEIGMKPVTYGTYETGARKVPIEFLVLLRDKLEIDLNWLVTGDSATDAAARSGARLGENLVSIPRYAVQAAAGSGALVQEEGAENFLVVSAAWLAALAPAGARVAALEAAGDSMYPTITDGDLIFINLNFQKRELSNGGIFVITVSDRTMVKRLQVMRNGDIKITSDNPHYEPENIPAEEAQESIIVHGKVFWAGGLLRGIKA
ncbi:MAG: helix-turn-helix domain-containing protein [Rhizobiales bacterium]|nr:helix-turn-helix domain-containing protein [Hyphomicrobiales bacterium]